VTDKLCEGSLSQRVESTAEWRAYPNPTEGSFEIEIPIVEDQVTIAIFTMDSQLISRDSYTVTNGRVRLDISDLSKGVYFTKIELANPISLQIIKQ